jgi:hypothetical protein
MPVDAAWTLLSLSLSKNREPPHAFKNGIDLI